MEQDLRAPSYLMMIPRDERDIRDPESVMDRLRAALEADPAVELRTLGFDAAEECPALTLGYRGAEYRALLYPEPFRLSGLYRLCHDIPQADMDRLEEEAAGLVVKMTFAGDAQAGLHLQLKVAAALASDALAAVDFSRERVLSPVWVRMAAESAVDPAPDYLFSLQAVAGEEGPVWLHTHGLNRCGLPELEALGVPRDRYQMVGEAVAGLARQGVDRGELPPEDGPVLLARLSGGDSLVVSWRRWEACLGEYPRDILGGAGDRDERHQRPSGVLSFYPSPEDARHGRRHPLGEMDPERYQNPIYLLTAGETDRMRALAAERLGWLRLGFTRPGARALVKLGLDVDADKRGEAGDGREHIWFALRALGEERLTGELTQEPYFAEGLHTGAVLEIGLDRLTDWLLYLDGRCVGPDDAYLLAER